LQEKDDSVKTIDDCDKSEIIISFIQNAIDDANLIAPNNVSKIKKWKLIDTPFIIGKELTTTYKLKRSYIDKHYINT
jgi:hypothetical protein